MHRVDDEEAALEERRIPHVEKLGVVAEIEAGERLEALAPAFPGRHRRPRPIRAGDRGAHRAPTIPSLRRGDLAPAEPAQAAVDPQLGQLLLDAVLGKAGAEALEVDG